jgi:hypothetical protein
VAGGGAQEHDPWIAGLEIKMPPLVGGWWPARLTLVAQSS